MSTRNQPLAEASGFSFADSAYTDQPIRDLYSSHRQSIRPAHQFSPLLHKEWSYISVTHLKDMTAEMWRTATRQKLEYLSAERVRQAMAMLIVQKDDPSYSYELNNYEHCLQSATMAMQAGEDEETIVCSLFHDLGFVACEESHGAFASNLLRPYISERSVWLLERHQWFQHYHAAAQEGIDIHARERWRGHPYFEKTADWVDRFDSGALRADMESAPLSVFEPMVERIFSREPRPMELPL